MNSVRVGLEKACSDNIVECPVALTDIYGSGTTSTSWQSDSVNETDCEPLLRRGELGAKLSVIEAVRKVGVVVSLVFQ